MIAGLIMAVCIPALILLGGNLSNSFNKILGSTSPKQTPALDMTASALEKSEALSPFPFAKAPGEFYKGTGYYAVQIDPQTGKPTIVQTNSSTIDVAGSNGNLNTLGSIIIADKLAQMADLQTDPELKNYYGEMAKLSYYMGAAEGELDDVSTFDLNGYTNGDALQSIYNNHDQLLSLMQNPPPNANAQQLQEVLPLATEVFNIGHNYVNQLSQFINTNGRVTNDFSVGGGGSGTGDPGGILTRVDRLTVDKRVKNKSVEQLLTYDEVKSMALEVLADYKVESTPVKTTLKDAQMIDTQSASKQKKG